jgi:hypothetical protein
MRLGGFNTNAAPVAGAACEYFSKKKPEAAKQTGGLHLPCGPERAARRAGHQASPKTRLKIVSTCLVW